MAYDMHKLLKDIQMQISTARENTHFTVWLLLFVTFVSLCNTIMLMGLVYNLLY